MSSTINWEFPVLGVIYNEEGMTNVIQTVNWVMTMTDGGYSASCNGSVILTPPSPASFIPYQNVTKAQVQQWTIDALGESNVASCESRLAFDIEVQKNNTGNLPPPWV